MKHITITVTSELEDIEPYLRDILTTMKDHDEVTDFSIRTSTFTERPVKEHSNNKSISNHEAAEILKLMPKQSEAIKKAIEVLEQEPCEDAVSRRATIEIARSNIHYGLDKEYEYSRELLEKTMAEINSLPSVTPKPKTGHWIMTGDYYTGAYGSIDYVKCSCCGEDSLEEGSYCPNCGAKMESEDKE